MLGHLHFFAENRPSSISPSPPPPPPPLSMLYQWAESALFRSNIDQGGGGTSLCANATLQSVENRAISEHVSCFQAVPRTFVQDVVCLPTIVRISSFRVQYSNQSLMHESPFSLQFILSSPRSYRRRTISLRRKMRPWNAEPMGGPSPQFSGRDLGRRCPMDEANSMMANST